MQNAAAYIRVSTDDQTEFSPDAQLNAIKNYCKNNNIVLSQEYVFVDAGISGRKAEKRPAFQKMIATAKTKPKPFDLILVHKFDRFARNREDSVVYKSLLRKDCDIKVVSITENIEDDKFSIILEAMLEAMAEYYSLNLSEEVKKGMTQKAYKGGVQTAPPFGYDVVNNKYVINEYQSEYVKSIYDKFLNGEYIKEIARWLNLKSVTTKRGNMFDTRAVEYILTNVAYIGNLKWNPNKKIDKCNTQEVITIENCHTPIISEENFLKAQNLLNDIKKRYVKYERKTNKSKHFLNGIFKCGNCGRALSLSGSSYQCHGYTKGLCNVSHSLSINKSEKIIYHILNSEFNKKFNGNNILIKIDLIKNNDDLTKLKKELKNNQDKLKRIKLAFENGVDTIEEYKENKNRVVYNIKQIQQSIENQNSKVETIDTNKLKEKIYNSIEIVQSDSYDCQTKHKVIKAFIHKIIFDKTNKQFNVYYN